MKLQERLKNISRKLSDLKKKDKEMIVFGAGDDKFFGTQGHHYELNKVLSEKEIADTEKKLGIKIPEEYREFLKVIGDGGAGPSWGLFTLRNTYPDDKFLEKYPDFCSMFCVYGDDYANGIRNKKKDDPYYMEKVEGFGGYLRLSDYGHGMTAYMVVGGDQQIGMMWFLNEDGDEPEIVPMMQPIKGREWQVGFLDWYENWLDESLEEVASKVKK